jgi:hypothetical protein
MLKNMIFIEDADSILKFLLSRRVALDGRSSCGQGEAPATN